jgi:uncharacterized membrane protein (DUF373 family)
MENLKSKLLTFPVKILAAIIAFMILMRFGYVFYDFIQNPFHEPVTLSEESVKHVMTGLILLELLAFTLRFIIQELVDPNLIVLTVLTAIGRDIIVLDIREIHYENLIAAGAVFAVTILGLYILKKKSE